VKLDGSPSDWLEEAGPAGARVVLRLGTEQFRSARRSAIGSAILREGILAGEGVLSALVPEHLELFRAQAVSPLLLGARELLPGPLPALDLLVHHASSMRTLACGSMGVCSAPPADRREPMHPRQPLELGVRRVLERELTRALDEVPHER
jgi:hypothetical protein